MLAVDADEVADVEELDDGVVLLRQDGALEAHLAAAAAIEERREGELAEAADGEQPARDADRRAVGLLRRIRQEVGRGKAFRVRSDSRLAELGELVEAGLAVVVAHRARILARARLERKSRAVLFRRDLR